ncbi:MAG: MtN3 and saliva related transrane protein [Sediminibacterium sp.]|nr:MtN3 and saliva related transrane protein [Sediminibacterium sp.]
MANLFSDSILVGTAAGVFTSVSLLPQLVKLIKEKKAQDISISMLLFLFIGLGLWIFYGLLKKDMPVIITNSFSLLTNIAIILFSLRYKKQEH